MIKFYEHQENALKQAEEFNRVAFYHDMGLGKTYTGAEKLRQLGARVNLVICQKSKVKDWVDHFKTQYRVKVDALDLSKKRAMEFFMFYTTTCGKMQFIGVINYELAWRRPELKKLTNFTLMLDESSIIANEKSRQSKFILALKPSNVILLSGTPVGGKYEQLWSQCKLLGWNINKTTFYKSYIETELKKRYLSDKHYLLIKGYKNVDHLKGKLKEYGAQFLKTDEVLTLPQQIHVPLTIPNTMNYKKFVKNSVIVTDTYEIVGDDQLKKGLGKRRLCGALNDYKLQAFEDLLNSCNDRLIVFYNFNEEIEALAKICKKNNRHMSIVNGRVHDLFNYETMSDTVTLVQYQAGAMGLNLQLANKIVYFTPCRRSALFEQSKKRIHRIGQESTCFYYYMTVKDSIEEDIYDSLKNLRDYTDYLFK